MRIVVRCPNCAEVRVEANAVVLRNCMDTDQWSYRFRCPECDRTTVASTGRRSGLAAAAVGVAVETWQLPRPSVTPAGAPFTALDALALRATLNERDWFETLRHVDARLT
jgi:hypothetical protein